MAFPDSAALYLSVALAIGLAAMIAAPLLLSTETVFSSSRLALLPISRRARSAARIPLGNPLRAMLVVVVTIWGAGMVIWRAAEWPVAVAQTIQFAALVTAALTLSLAIEDAIRLRRAVAVHQIVFLLGVIAWPVVIQLLFEPGRLVPAPEWARGPAAVVLLTGGGSPAASLAVAAGWFAIAAAVLTLHRRVVLDAEGRPAAPPSGVRWTAFAARVLAGPSRDSRLRRELLIPPRFLFLRLCLVFIGLASLAALVTGQPLGLLSLAFWWLPLSTNLLGPDSPDGVSRYALMGRPVTWTFRPRLVAMCILSATIFAVVATVAVLAGWAIPPVVGPPSPLSYLAAALFGISLLPLWAIGGDRYSLRFSDPLEMRTLLPERRRSAGAIAGILLVCVWFVTAIVAAAIAGIALFAVHMLVPGPLSGGKLLGAAALAAIVNVSLHRIHESRLVRRSDHAR
jgi:hypothetical protein